MLIRSVASTRSAIEVFCQKTDDIGMIKLEYYGIEKSKPCSVHLWRGLMDTKDVASVKCSFGIHQMQQKGGPTRRPLTQSRRSFRFSPSC